MTVQLLSFPFRLMPNGRLAKVDQDSEEQVGEAIAALVLTHPGERELVPELGINDPAFDTLYSSQIESQVEDFEVPCTITDVLVQYTDDTRQDVIIFFDFD